MSTESLTDLCKRLASRRVLLHQTTDARVMEALRDDIAVLEKQVAQRRDKACEVIDFASIRT